MTIEFVPLLQIQRDLHRIPRGPARFEEYLRVMLNDARDEPRLPPLAAMNPMGKDHITALLDALLAIDAEGIAAQAVARASAKVGGVSGDYKMGLVVVDDLMGGWTNRYDVEYSLRFPKTLKAGRGWLSGVLWSSESATEAAVSIAATAPVYRAAFIERHGPAHTLRDRLAQEGYVMTMAGMTEPSLSLDDLAYTREVLAPLLDESNKRISIECLFGDSAARTLGFTPRGLSDGAGLALAIHEARGTANPVEG